MGISYHFVLLYYHPKPFIIRNKYANIPANPNILGTESN